MKKFAADHLSGFALTEALVALLLLAIAMLGAGAAMIQAVAGQRAALLQTRAADLAGDLAEALRTAPDRPSADAEIRSWRAAALALLPQAEALVLPRALTAPEPAVSLLPTHLEIRLQWRDGAARGPARLWLPLAFTTSFVAP